MKQSRLTVAVATFVVKNELNSPPEANYFSTTKGAKESKRHKRKSNST